MSQQPDATNKNNASSFLSSGALPATRGATIGGVAVPAASTKLPIFAMHFEMTPMIQDNPVLQAATLQFRYASLQHNIREVAEKLGMQQEHPEWKKFRKQAEFPLYALNVLLGQHSNAVNRVKRDILLDMAGQGIAAQWENPKKGIVPLPEQGWHLSMIGDGKIRVRSAWIDYLQAQQQLPKLLGVLQAHSYQVNERAALDLFRPIHQTTLVPPRLRQMGLVVQWNTDRDEPINSQEMLGKIVEYIPGAMPVQAKTDVTEIPMAVKHQTISYLRQPQDR